MWAIGENGEGELLASVDEDEFRFLFNPRLIDQENCLFAETRTSLNTEITDYSDTIRIPDGDTDHARGVC